MSNENKQESTNKSTEEKIVDFLGEDAISLPPLSENTPYGATRSGETMDPCE